MALDSADLIAGIASLAGPVPVLGTPSERVNVLHIHGTADATVSYFDSTGTNPNTPLFYGAPHCIQMWAGYNGATDCVTDPAPSLDLDSSLAGLDTTVTRYVNCPPGGAVELWTINGGGHIPTLSTSFAPKVIDWLLAHPKP
jgi:polyhydroxybutyrate depolymerase